MRTTVVTVLLALAALVVFSVAIYHFRGRVDQAAVPGLDATTSAENHPDVVESPPASALAGAATPPTAAAPASVAPAPGGVPRVPSEFVGQETLNEEMVEAKVAELAAFTEVADTNSLRALVRHLDHPMATIRAAALAEIVNVASRDAIPMLKEVAARTVDAREKVKIIEAIDYLELPTLTEWRKAKGKLPGSSSSATTPSAPAPQP